MRCAMGNFRNLAALFICGVALLAASSWPSYGKKSPEPAKGRNGPPVPARPSLTQRHCYCIQATSNAYQPYKILSYPTQPECKSVRLELAPPGPWNYLLNCEDLRDCHRSSQSCGKKITELFGRITKAQSDALKCSTVKCRQKVEWKEMEFKQTLNLLLEKCKSTSNICYKKPLPL